jgi:two-component system LytT family sensor kinase
LFCPGASFHLAVLFTTNQKRMRKAGETFNFELIFMPAMSRNTRYWLSQLGGWGLFGLIQTFFAFSFDKLGSEEERIFFFARLGIFVLLGLLFTHLMRMLIISLNVLQKSLEKQLLYFVFITFIFASIISFVDIEMLIRFSDRSFLRNVDLVSDNEKKVLRNPENSYFSNKLLVVLSGAFYFFIYFFIWNLIYFTYHFITKSQKQQLDTLKLEALVKELELKTIKAHINPHFIFNSLNGIRALIDEDPNRARNAITELSNILRSSMQTDKLESVSLEKELNIVKDYLALENMRFEDRLRVEYEIDEDTLDQPVPPMMLQTLVENAIKHGISKQITGGKIRIVSDFKDSYHELAVQNTGKLVNGTAKGDGFGLPSTLNRLSLLYGEKARFSIKQLTSEVVEARVMLPVQMTI